MDHEETPFEKLFTERLKQRNISIKKISEMTGISRAHIENIASGNFRDMPSAPYFRGYLIRLGKILDFDGERWWDEIQKENILKKSGPKDTLPRNRFAKKRPMKFIWAGAILAIAIVYIFSQFTRISGTPSLSLSSPTENPYITSSSEITLQGTVANADSLFLVGNNEEIPITTGGSWQENVFLSPNNPNTFEIKAKKFLGGESDIVEQVIYNEPTIITPATTTPELPINASKTASSTSK